MSSAIIAPISKNTSLVACIFGPIFGQNEHSLPQFLVKMNTRWASNLTSGGAYPLLFRGSTSTAPGVHIKIIIRVVQGQNTLNFPLIIL